MRFSKIGIVLVLWQLFDQMIFGTIHFDGLDRVFLLHMVNHAH